MYPLMKPNAKKLVQKLVLDTEAPHVEVLVQEACQKKEVATSLLEKMKGVADAEYRNQ